MSDILTEENLLDKEFVKKELEDTEKKINFINKKLDDETTKLGRLDETSKTWLRVQVLILGDYRNILKLRLNHWQ